MQELNPEKARVIHLVGVLLERANISKHEAILLTNRYLAEMFPDKQNLRTTYELFGDHFWWRAERGRQETRPEWVVAFLNAVTDPNRLPPEKRCTVVEALELARLKHLPGAFYSDLRHVFASVGSEEAWQFDKLSNIAKKGSRVWLIKFVFRWMATTLPTAIVLWIFIGVWALLWSHSFNSRQIIGTSGATTILLGIVNTTVLVYMFLNENRSIPRLLRWGSLQCMLSLVLVLSLAAVSKSGFLNFPSLDWAVIGGVSYGVLLGTIIQLSLFPQGQLLEMPRLWRRTLVIAPIAALLHYFILAFALNELPEKLDLYGIALLFLYSSQGVLSVTIASVMFAVGIIIGDKLTATAVT